MNVNIAIVGGNLTRDPEVRYSKGGSAICSCSIASSRKWKTESGEQREETLFLDIVAFGLVGERMGEYLKKGSQVLLEGRLRYETWEDKSTGAKRSKISMLVDKASWFRGDNQQKQDSIDNQKKLELEKDDIPF